MDTAMSGKSGNSPLMPHRRMSNSSLQSASGSDGTFTTGSCDNLIPNIGETVSNSFTVFIAMCLLRFRRLIRNPMSLFFMVFMPVVMVVIGFAVVKSQNIPAEQAKVEFTLSKGKMVLYNKKKVIQ
jgi:hypothetical protein